MDKDLLQYSIYAYHRNFGKDSLIDNFSYSISPSLL